MDKEENKDQKNRKVVRIFYNDPDATDSDSDADDDGNMNIQGGNNYKRKEIVIFHDHPPQPTYVQNPVQNIENADQERCGKIDDQKTNNLQKSSSKYKGVMKVGWRRHGAAIPDLKKNKWLGTHDSEEDAAKAYHAEEKKIMARKKAKANEMKMVDAELPELPCSSVRKLIKELKFISQEFNPGISTDGELLYNCNLQERPRLSELLLVEDMPREQRMVMAGSGNIGEPSNEVNAAMKKAKEERQPFLRSKSSVGKESSILRITEQFPANVSDHHHASGKLEVSTSFADPPMSPSISSILNFEENLQNVNDLEVLLGLRENLQYRIQADEHLDRLNEDIDHLINVPELVEWLYEHLDTLNVDTDLNEWLNVPEIVEWLNENSLNDEENP